jgi:glycine hydroxymethyltransferase
MGKDYENPMGITAPKSGRTKMMSEIYDSNVMPGIQGGPLMHVIMAKAVAFGEALEDSFAEYVKQVRSNAKALSDEMKKLGFDVISDGTDNHLILVDVTNKDISGKKAEQALEKAAITVNKNMIPFDQKSPFVTSGIRIGTPAMTTRGMKEEEMKEIAELIDKAIKNNEDETKLGSIKKEVNELCSKFPLYPELLSN